MLRRKYYLDLHVHTARYSPCSGIDPEELIAAARARRLDGIALTEHEHCWNEAEIAELKAATGGKDFIILAGTEVRTMDGDRHTGDLLVFGAAAPFAGPCTIDQVCSLTHQQGGIVIAPHPYAGLQGIGEEMRNCALDGLEVCNFRYRSPTIDWLAERAWRGSGLAGLGASDAHDVEDIGCYCTEFDIPIRNLSDLMEAIQNRRCRPRRGYPPRRLGHLF